MAQITTPRPPLGTYRALSSFAGIDSTGATDSRAGFVTALAAVAGTNLTLLIDCSVKLTIGFDYSKSIMVDNNTKVAFTPAGKLLVDTNLVPLFAFVHATGIRFWDLNIERTGTYDIDYLTNNSGAGFNDVTKKNWLASNRGITWTNSNPHWQGPTQTAALLYFGGNSYDIVFERPRFCVPVAALASTFIPCVATSGPEYKANTTVLNGPTLTSSNGDLPSDITFNEPYFDGVLMGLVGSANGVTVRSPRAKRYSDYQTAAGGTLGGTSTWFSPPHLIYLQDGGFSGLPGRGYRITDCIDDGVYVGASGVRGASGHCVSLKIGAVDTLVDGYYSGRRDGLMDVLASAGPVTLRKLKAVFDSTIHAADGLQAVRFPDAGPYLDLTIDGMELIDTAAAPAFWPIGDHQGASNERVSMTGVRVTVEDWPAGNTASPGFAVNGKHVKLDVTNTYKAFGATQTSRGPMVLQGNQGSLQGSSYDCKVHGWRAIASNFDGLKPRMLMAHEDQTMGSWGRVRDITNGYEAVIENGIKTENWTQRVVVTPTDAAATYDTAIVVPANFVIDRFGVVVTTTLGNADGLTTFGVGWSGSANALLAAVSRSFYTNTVGNASVSTGGSNRTIRLTADAGTFDGTGEVIVSVRASRFLGSDTQ